MDFLRKYKWHILSVLVTLIVGALVVGVWAVQRQNVTDDEAQRARTNCVEWMVTYDVGSDATSAITTCQTAENADPTSFYFRWVPGQYGKIDPPKPEDIPSAVTDEWVEVGAG